MNSDARLADSARFERALAAIDALNAEDPATIADGGVNRPAELVYGERMSAMLATFAPGAGEPLQLAARAQHLRRWTIPRSDYPMDRTGYLRWRTTLKARHAEWAGEALSACGYGPEEIARVQSLIRKEALKRDSDAQTLEDVACLVFLAYYARDFAAKHDGGKVAEILRKTWAKMSPEAQRAAHALDLDPAVRAAIAHALGTNGH